jgi:hypothetical protein
MQASYPASEASASHVYLCLLQEPDVPASSVDVVIFYSIVLIPLPPACLLSCVPAGA